MLEPTRVTGIYILMIDFLLGRTPKKRRRRRRRRRKARRGDARFEAGDSVVVKPGTVDPDFGVEIGGWQGRIAEEPGANGMVLISWDGLTFQNIPDSAIAECEKRGLDWTRMVLEAREVEPTSPRDTEEDVAESSASFPRNMPGVGWARRVYASV